MVAGRLGLGALVAIAAAVPAAQGAEFGTYRTPIAVAQAHAVGDFPGCDDGRVLARVSRDFDWAHQVTWRSGLSILAIDRIAETPDGHYPANVFARRYCRANAALANGDQEPLYYRIEFPGGFAGTGWHVTFCLPGYDPWRVHGQSCSAIRPQ